ncbi:GMC oxidoreductase [Dyella terrae]|uniref:GMC oxidoreductase n=1 Tax=Dyella terrae TaxID=522259 RepID=UPI003D18F3B3
MVTAQRAHLTCSCISIHCRTRYPRAARPPSCLSRIRVFCSASIRVAPRAVAPCGIASRHAEDAPRIDPNYLSTDKDIAEVIQGSRLIRRIMQTEALRSITVKETLPGPQVETDADMLSYFRENSGSIYHLCGSCAMGADPATSVVDKHLKVHGIDGLRVVDASIFPNITSGNINAATMMVAERGASLILRDSG